MNAPSVLNQVSPSFSLGQLELEQPVKRVEDSKFLRGAKCYVDDFQIPGMLYASILRSPHAHARIVAIDASRALSNPKVKLVVDGKDAIEHTKPLPPRYVKGVLGLEQYCLATSKVRFVGEPVLAVAADDRYSAEDALDDVHVLYERLDAVVRAEEAIKEGAPILYEKIGSNLIWRKTYDYGNIERDFERAELTIKREFAVHRYSSTALDSTGCIANYDYVTGELTVWCNTPFPGLVVESISNAFSIPTNRIRLVVPSIGGNFGNKTTMTRFVLITCLLSIKSRRPVKWIESRSEQLTSSSQSPRQLITAELAVKKDGTLLGIRVKEIVDEGADAEFAAYHTQGRLQTVVGLYKIRSIRVDGYSVLTNTCPSGPNRGVAKPAMGFVLERMVNIAAKALGLDPIDIRLRNYIQPQEFPYTTPSGQCYDSGEYATTLNKLLKSSVLPQWLEFKRVASTQGRCVGIGIATCVEPGGYNSASSYLITGQLNRTGGYEPASVRVDRNGKVTISLSGPDAGQGHSTSATQLVACILGINLEDIHVIEMFDTFHSPYGSMSGNYANKFSVLDISAVVKAAIVLRSKILAIASKNLDVEQNTLDISSGMIFCTTSPEKRMSLSDVVDIAYSDTAKLPVGIEPGLHQTLYYASPFAKPPDALGRVSTKITFGSSAHLAVIEVDVETGKIRLVHYEVVHDCGRTINPSIVDGQIQGSTAHGIAATLQEEFLYNEDGQPLSSTFMDYLAATATDVPEIFVSQHGTPSPHSLLGTKGVGEGGATPPLAAIGNALDDALSSNTEEPNSLPLTPEKVLKMLKNRTSFR